MPLFSKSAGIAADPLAAIRELYHVGTKVGSGAFSDVYAGQDKSDGKSVAIKCIEKAKMKGKLDVIEKEIEIMRLVDHPNALKLYNHVESPDYSFIVTQLLSGGELFDRIINRGHYTEKDAVAVLKDCLSAVSWLHSHHIVHRDIKPENLIFETSAEDAKIIVSDYGLACIVTSDEDMPTKACGTPGYVAPEVLRKGVSYGFKSDIWSIGVVGYIMLCGYPPFYSEDEESDAEMYKDILAGKYEFDSPYWDDITPAAISFVSSLLEMDTTKRLSAEEALVDPWICHNVAGDVNLHRSVSKELKKNFPKSRWKSAFNAQVAILRMKGSLASLMKEAVEAQAGAGDEAAAVE